MTEVRKEDFEAGVELTAEQTKSAEGAINVQTIGLGSNSMKCFFALSMGVDVIYRKWAERVYKEAKENGVEPDFGAKVADQKMVEEIERLYNLAYRAVVDQGVMEFIEDFTQQGKALVPGSGDHLVNALLDSAAFGSVVSAATIRMFLEFAGKVTEGRIMHHNVPYDDPRLGRNEEKAGHA